LERTALGIFAFAILLIAGVQIANAGEVIPSIGMTRAIDSSDDEARVFGGLAFRGRILPILKSEIGVSYRTEEVDPSLTMRMWPVTASLWLTPIPALYAGAGVGWYHTTLDYDQDEIAFPIDDETRQEFGIHIGGGVNVPLGTQAGLDLQGRYVMMRDQESRLIPEKFDADFWQSSLGLAIHF
jgi:hypothetical protein